MLCYEWTPQLCFGSVNTLADICRTVQPSRREANMDQRLDFSLEWKIVNLPKSTDMCVLSMELYRYQRCDGLAELKECLSGEVQLVH